MIFKVDQLYQEVLRTEVLEDQFYNLNTYSIKKSIHDFGSNEDLKKIEFLVLTKTDTLSYLYVVPNFHNE